MNCDSLKGLMPEDYQHPGEIVAMKVLKAVPMMDKIMDSYLTGLMKVDMYPRIVGNYYRVTEETCPRLYRLYKLALKRLDMPKEYPIFVALAYEYNACAFGGAEPFFVINSSFLKSCTDEELLFILGHEIGHIKSGHTTYFNIARNLNSILANLHIAAAVASIGIEYALKEWGRNAEFTSDRAGVIAAGGNMEACYSAVMKLLGQSDDISDMDFSIDKVLEQAEDFELDSTGVIGKVLYVSATMENSHPWAILRLKHIYDWYNSGDFTKLIEKFN